MLCNFTASERQYVRISSASWTLIVRLAEKGGDSYYRTPLASPGNANISAITAFPVLHLGRKKTSRYNQYFY